jgi:uncharacterized membrane protein SpoIIM required for sporulation
VKESSSQHALQTALLKRTALWQKAADRARRLSGGNRIEDVADATALVEDYRMLAHDLSRARRLIPQSRAREFLESAYAQAHATIYRPATHPGYALWGFFRDQIPRAASELKQHILWVTLLFILTILAGAWLVYTYPELIGLFASPALIATVERGELWTAGILNIVPSSVLSLQILTNNVTVTMFSFCAGFLFGLGTFYIIGLNGLLVGAIYSFTAQHGLGDDLFQFMAAHGFVELSVMCLSGAAGAAIGEALIRPDTPRRSEAFQRAAVRSSKLMVACIVLLIGCGFIEGYVSPNPDFPLWSRLVVGIGYWLFMLALLRGWLFGRSRSFAPIAT